MQGWIKIGVILNLIFFMYTMSIRAGINIKDTLTTTISFSCRSANQVKNL